MGGHVLTVLGIQTGIKAAMRGKHKSPMLLSVRARACLRGGVQTDPKVGTGWW